MPEKQAESGAHEPRTSAHTIPRAYSRAQKEIFLSFHRNICFRRSAAREDLLAFPVPGLCMRSFAVCFAGRGGTTKGRYPPVAFRGITADEAAALPDAGGAWCVRVFPAKAARRRSCGRLCDPSAKTFVLFDDGVYRFDDGGLEARLFERMDALNGCAAGRGDFIDQRHRMLAGFLAELCRA